MAYHTPVLLDASIDGLNIKPNGTYVDLTFGGGGHSRGILEKLSNKGTLYGFDQDTDSAANTPTDKRFTLIHGNFRFLSNYLRYHNVPLVDGILADLGVSSHHFDSPNRGFSFRHRGPLDMRMNTLAKLSAETVVNSYPSEKLAEIFKLYGELPQPTRLAHKIAEARAAEPIRTVEQFAELLLKLFPQKVQNKMMAQAFQAIRIEVNNEMQALRQMLEQTQSLLAIGGRLVVISYHSLEDRLVKNFMKAGNFEGKVEVDFYGHVSSPFKIITRRVVVPSEEECQKNSRARSAKLRVAEKL